MCRLASKWTCISFIAVMTAALPASLFAGTNLNLKNHVAVAQEVDELIVQKLTENGQAVEKSVSDEEFLRRITLDLAGRIPSVNEMTLFALDPDPLKRDKLIQNLIDSEEFTENWAAYWRDVIFSRATDPRARVFQGVFEKWIREQLASNRPWDEVVTEIITATGDVRENGSTGLIFAHQGEPKDIAAEVSRIFMGIQIQCANCHDHPTDVWTREQFHEMVAFFPRIRVRRTDGDGPRSFEVVSFDRAPGRNPRSFLENPERIIRNFDKNNDNKISKNEVAKNKQFARFFNRMVQLGDKNEDGALSAEEIKGLPKPANNRRTSVEHYMSDLSDPSARGTLMNPVFFVSKTETEHELGDLERRNKLARFVTDVENPWFAKAFVNRLWTEMQGRGFYMPVDDMGPFRNAEHEEAIELLSQAFVANEYDVKWLYRTIANTKAYQRDLGSSNQNSEIDEPVSFACATPTRLRSEQIFASLMELSGLEEKQNNNGRRGPGRNSQNSVKAQFSSLFSYDPSKPQSELMGTIPQSLFMMNSQTIEKLVSATGTSPLARFVRKYENNEEAISELYLLVLSRSPSKNELSTCQNYLKQSDNRNEGFEDIMWSLVNSSEFISKR